MIEADLVTINALEWTTFEQLLMALERHYREFGLDADYALGQLVEAYQTAAIQCAHVPYDALKAYLNSDTILVQMAIAHEKPRGPTKEQIEAFAAECGILKGRIKSQEFCRKHPLRPADLPWFKDETGRLYAIYFLLESAWCHWGWMRPAMETDATSEELPVKPKGRPSKIPALKQAMRDKIKAGETTLEELERMSGQDLEDMFDGCVKDGAKKDTCRDALAELISESRGKMEK
jgi:hypothetical protein